MYEVNSLTHLNEYVLRPVYISFPLINSKASGVGLQGYGMPLLRSLSCPCDLYLKDDWVDILNPPPSTLDGVRCDTIHFSDPEDYGSTLVLVILYILFIPLLSTPYVDGGWSELAGKAFNIIFRG